MGVRVDGAAGPLALGAKGSACDRLTPYRRALGSRSRELYSIAALARYGAFGTIFIPSLATESIERFILSPGWGKVRRSRIRGSRVAANHQNTYHVI